MFSENQLKERAAKERAAMAVRQELPKTSLQEVIDFLGEDELRYVELKKYLLCSVRMGDTERFLPNVLRRVIGLMALRKGYLPDVLVKLVTEVALEGGAYEDEVVLREAMRLFLLKMQRPLESLTLKNP